MQLNCEASEFQQMALLMTSEKINALEQRVEELLARCEQQARQIAGLEADVKVRDETIRERDETLRERDKTIEELRQQIVEMSLKYQESAMAAWMLKQFLVLSRQKAKVYVSSMDNDTRAQLGQFMFQSLPDNAPPMLVEYVRTLTQPDPPKSIISVAHADVAVGVAEDGANVFHHQSNNEEGDKNHGRE